ncbi:hypothetical protein NXS08_00645 [Gleimia sp. 6138-11-ORH1]|uniref:hypothetical protein n=1 Tax=Gleimia sp. 6138-11-ORH1 TaxID=2973937 RepID=UPI0021699703|nr:hypothetical protein [Gleimia sp. 6138-11-ORH1]MCS4484000.1 hypothetical protein [Gleimia sp. 6138-11-ORH1]
MKQDVSDWFEFKIEDLFESLEGGKALQMNLEENPDIFYAGAKKDNNGVMQHCKYDEDTVSKGNCAVLYAMFKARLAMSTTWIEILQHPQI